MKKRGRRLQPSRAVEGGGWAEGAEECVEHITNRAKGPGSQAKRGRKPKVSKSEARKVNNFRLHDIAALINGRHSGWCDDPEWLVRYFYAALPQLVVSKARWLDAVRGWISLNLPLLEPLRGMEWIENEARACHAKAHKCPRTDKLARLLAVQENEWFDFGLCTIPAASRPEPVRDAADRKRRRQTEQDRRAKDPTHTPRSESKAAKARANGTTAAALRAKAWREKRKAGGEGVSCPAHDMLDAPRDDQSERVSCPSQETETERFSCPTIPMPVRTLFVPHNNTNPRRIEPVPGIEAATPTKPRTENRAAA